MRLERGGRFLAMFEGTARTLLFSDAWRFAKDDVVEDENDERRFWVDILISRTEQEIKRKETLRCFVLLFRFFETLAEKRKRE